MRYFTLFLLFCCLSIQPVQGQTQMINPTTHPFSVSDMEIFPDGTVYMISYWAPFMVRMQNIDNPWQGKPEFIFLKNKRFERLECADKLNCLGFRYLNYSTGYIVERTHDGGRTWQRKKNLDGFEPYSSDFRYINSRFLILFDWDNNRMYRSLDFGQSKQAYNLPGNMAHNLRFLGHNGRFVFYLKHNTDSIFQFSPSQYKFFASASQFSGITEINRFEPTSKGYLVEHDTGKISLVNLSLSQVTPIFDRKRYIADFINNVDTIAVVHFGDSTRILDQSHDGGLTWQTDTIPPVEPNYDYFGRSGLDHVDGLYHGKIYYSEGQNGRWRMIDILQKKEKFVNSNRYPKSAMALERLDSNTFIFHSNKNYVHDTTTSIAFLDAQGKEKRNIRLKAPFKFRSWRPVWGLFDFHFKDSRFGFGYNDFTGGMIVTHDGGNSWRSFIFDSLHLPLKTPKHAQFLPKNNEILLVSGRTMIFLDTNFKLLHQQQSQIPLSGGTTAGFYFENRQKGIVVNAGGGSVFLTDNGAYTYRKVTSTGSKSIPPIERLQVNSKGFYLLGNKSIYHSKNMAGPFQKIAEFRGPSFPILDNYHFTDSRKIIDYEGYRQKLHSSADSGKTFQSAPFIAEGEFSSVYQTTDSTYLLTAYGGQIFLLQVKDSLIVADSSSNFIPINFGSDTSGSGNPVALEEQVSRIAFFPNPAQKHIILQFENPSPRTVKIFDLQGRLQLTREVSSERVKLPIAELPGGMYVLQVHLPQGETRAMKFLKLE